LAICVKSKLLFNADEGANRHSEDSTMRIDIHQIWSTLSSVFAVGHQDRSSTLWSQHGSYPPRSGNDLEVLIDGQNAYHEIAAAFHRARKFIYLTISFGEQDFLLVPESGQGMFDILRSRQMEGVDIRMVIWQPAEVTSETIPNPAPKTIPGVNDGPTCIQARWDIAKGYQGMYCSPRNHF